MNKLAPYAKAVRGSLVAGLLALATALADSHVSPLEYVGIALAVLSVGGTVAATTNKPEVVDMESHLEEMNP